MNFCTNLQVAKAKILNVHPELLSSSFTSDCSGETNFVVKVDDYLIFRFPRDEAAYESLRLEVQILPDLAVLLPKNIEIPRFIELDLSLDSPFVSYLMIKGHFATKENLSDHSIKLLADFLSVLHSLDYAKYGLTIPDLKQFYSNLYQEIQKKIFPKLSKQSKQYTDQLFQHYLTDESLQNCPYVLAHSDLSSNHIIITDKGIGIIDFGDLRVNDPAYDFIWAEDFGVFDNIYKNYNGEKDVNFRRRIIEFYQKRTIYYALLNSVTNNPADFCVSREILENQQ
jgi:aminoglycoside 2''-phosphotransferase